MTFVIFRGSQRWTFVLLKKKWKTIRNFWMLGSKKRFLVFGPPKIDFFDCILVAMFLCQILKNRGGVILNMTIKKLHLTPFQKKKLRKECLIFWTIFCQKNLRKGSI